MSTNFDKHIKLLQEAAEGRLPDMYHANGGGDTETFGELYRAGLLSCTNPGQIDGVAEFDNYVNPRITVLGREYLVKWERERKESGFWWQLFHVLRKAALWVGLLLGVAATKLVELGVEKIFEGSPK